MLFDTCFTSNCSLKRQRNYQIISTDLNPTLINCNNLLKGLIKQEMSDKEIVEHLFSLLCASLSSTTNIASFMCLLLAQNQTVQDNLRKEIYMTTGKFYLCYFI